jgi:S1-C subfamily serine protease
VTRLLGLSPAIYDKTTITLHRATAILDAIQFLIGRTTTFLPSGPLRVDIWSIHVLFGVTLAVAGVDNKMGALLAQIEPDGPAAQARLLPGDVVIRLDSVEVNGVDDLIRALDRDRIDGTLEMDVPRMGRLRTVDIHPVERKPAASRKWS